MLISISLFSYHVLDVEGEKTDSKMIILAFSSLGLLIAFAMSPFAKIISNQPFVGE